MATEVEDFLPFSELSAWFSCSVNPLVVKSWVKHGGVLAGEKDANYLFSDDPFTTDTIRLYSWQKYFMVVKSSWIHEVLQQNCQIEAVDLGKHLLPPHFKENDSSIDPSASTNATTTVITTKPKEESDSPSKTTSVTAGSSAYAQYNAIWNSLEEESLATPVESLCL